MTHKEAMTHFERNLPYKEGSYLDQAYRQTRQRIEQVTIDDA